ncbi:unnamed protein product, partial [Mesorhabditis spiculigera]
MGTSPRLFRRCDDVRDRLLKAARAFVESSPDGTPFDRPEQLDLEAPQRQIKSGKIQKPHLDEMEAWVKEYLKKVPGPSVITTGEHKKMANDIRAKLDEMSKKYDAAPRRNVLVGPKTAHDSEAFWHDCQPDSCLLVEDRNAVVLIVWSNVPRANVAATKTKVEQNFKWVLEAQTKELYAAGIHIGRALEHRGHKLAHDERVAAAYFVDRGYCGALGTTADSDSDDVIRLFHDNEKDGPGDRLCYNYFLFI